jgi:modulator of FtsH protease HflK
MKTLRYVLLFLFVAYLLTGVAQIGPEERAVVRRFGKVVAKPGPGLWIGLPWGLDRLDRVPTATVRRVTVGYQPEAIDDSPMPAGQLLTGDQNLVNVQVAVDYALAEGETALEDYVMQRDHIDGVIAREAEAVMAEWVAGRTVDEVLLAGNAELPSRLVRQVQKRTEPYRLGVRITQASVAYLAPPEEVRSAFEEVNRAQTNIRTQEYRARQEEQARLRAASAEKFRLEQEARAAADAKLSQARAEAEAFGKRLESYRRLKEQNPDVLTAIWWDEMGRVLLSLKGRGRIDLLDNHLGADGLDITQVVPPGKRR